MMLIYSIKNMVQKNSIKMSGITDYVRLFVNGSLYADHNDKFSMHDSLTLIRNNETIVNGIVSNPNEQIRNILDSILIVDKFPTNSTELSGGLILTQLKIGISQIKLIMLIFMVMHQFQMKKESMEHHYH